ncbi:MULTISPECIES: acyl-CoA carboxylase subunit beta [Jonquetella]|uniref:Acetyl-CoA carboxylase, carboxyltransferase component (Subunits alpha and beta) n=1 Tax=Jonquetella anthropi DSM 22815 TaxID=885272 RepID=H0UK63_9BACT|nr:MULTISPECIES: acyl-CoA carboxylase subunit beta [Jonquetella]EEX48453.1 carboxyl transferase domain protein [Jonquetella anthropi E3_33 E1]EHM13072.1 acetyl-CoA carboxylase, carboxyltransferase component (subunits alpha and beta) [Jonquetella anthropi DSM 22815]ERL23893.1 carboxyl transferase domain protein [Jonquetella sp. BV3C21]
MAVKTIEELCGGVLERRAEAAAGGGEKAVAKHKAKGRLTARERIAQLMDEGSFVELDEFIEHRCTNFGMEKKKYLGDGVVTGYGTVNGRIVYVFSQDFTVLGGSLGEMHAQKICKVMDLALRNGCPIVGINDSGGARIQEAVDALNGYGEIFYRNTLSSGVIPQMSVILGPTAGGAVYSPALTDYIFMVDKISVMHITGPAVIKAVTGEDVTSEELGGATAHNTKSGNAHFFAKTEQECFEQVRSVLSYLPSNNMDDPVFVETSDPIDRADVSLREIVPTNPNRGYDVHKVIQAIVDDGKFLEVQSMWAKNIIIGYARFGGQSVGIVANQAGVMAGCLDIDCSDKASRFIRHCDAFNIPIVTLVDVPGYLPGKTQEWNGIIRHGAKLLYAYSEATVPLITVVLRKAYGGAYLGMCSKSLGADCVLAWPQAQIAVMGAEGAANIIFRKEIEAAEDQQAMRAQKISEYEDAFATPYQAASHGMVDKVILPEETRCEVIKALAAHKTKRQALPRKKHGVIPH